jgi:unsaturated rhamnogalacturonyl hydrolase
MLYHNHSFLLITGIMACALQAQAQATTFGSLPQDDNPQQVGTLLAEHFLASGHQYPQNPTLHYSEVVSWYGALTVAKATHNTVLLEKLAEKFTSLMPGGSEQALIPKRDHVDDLIFGVVPLEIGMDTGKKEYLRYGQSWADREWRDPQQDGLSGDSRFWVDDMYMITLLQVEAYRATGEAKYIDRAAREVAAYLDKLQRPSGLFFHADDVPIYWGRGDGWAAAGMAELLRSLPKDHPLRSRILRGYRLMMDALVRYQSPDGMWRQIIDNPAAWPETSSSGMFTFALVTGVKEGWLSGARYTSAARRAWIAIVGYIDQNENVTNVCEGTNKKNDVSYYLERKRWTGDFHGQAATLWAATAMIR